jgi:hypothetical protein
MAHIRRMDGPIGIPEKVLVVAIFCGILFLIVYSMVQ